MLNLFELNISVSITINKHNQKINGKQTYLVARVDFTEALYKTQTLNEFDKVEIIVTNL